MTTPTTPSTTAKIPMYTDRKGHVYESDAALESGIQWLEQDAEYLRGQTNRSVHPAVNKAVAKNAEHSAEYATHLRELRHNQPSA